jgi:ABC-type hemin transport system ATPase subunit
LPARRIQQHFSRLVKSLGVEQRDSFVQAGGEQRRVALPRLPEELKRFRPPASVHFGDATIVQLDRFRGAHGRPLRAAGSAALTARDSEAKHQGKRKL